MKKRDNNRERGKKPAFDVNRFALLAASMALINFLTSMLVNFLKLPIFLDTWATSLGVVIGGVWVGVAGGVLYNFLMALLTSWGPSSWVWGFCSAAVALVTWLFWKNGWFDLRKPLKLLVAGLGVGLVTAVTGFGVQVVFFGGHATNHPVAVVYNAFLNWTGNNLLASFLEQVAINIVDKPVSVFIAAGVAFLIMTKKEEGKTGGKMRNARRGD